jgi:hypothetical protein
MPLFGNSPHPIKRAVTGNLTEVPPACLDAIGHPLPTTHLLSPLVASVGDDTPPVARPVDGQDPPATENPPRRQTVPRPFTGQTPSPVVKDQRTPQQVDEGECCHGDTPCCGVVMNGGVVHPMWQYICNTIRLTFLPDTDVYSSRQEVEGLGLLAPLLSHVMLAGSVCCFCDPAMCELRPSIRPFAYLVG